MTTTELTNTTNTINMPEPAPAPMRRLWNRGDALRIAGIFVLAFLVSQIVVGLLLAVIGAEPFAVTMLSLLTSALGGVGAVLLVNARRTRHSWADLGFTAPTRRWLGIATVGALVLGVVRGTLLTWLSTTFPVLNFGVEALAEALMMDDPVQMAIVASMTFTVVAFWEEVFFRGYIHNVLRNRLGMWAAIIVSSLLFGLFHIIPLQILGAFTLGLFLAWVYERSGSLWVAIYAHALNNLIFMGLAFLTTM